MFVILCEIDWIEILSAILTPMLAIFGIIIGFQQLNLNKIRYKYELYGRRLDVYKSLRKLLNNTANIDYDSVMIIFDSLTESYFLFDDDIPLYLKEVWDKTNDLAYINSKIEEGSGDLDEKRLELIHWLSNQYEVSKSKFDPYLQCSK